MSNRTSGNRTTELQLGALLNGLKTKVARTESLSVAGVVYTRDELAKVVEDYLAIFKGAREARAIAREKAHERDRERAETRRFLAEVRSMLNSQFGSESPALLDFGFAPRKKKAEPTFDEKVAAVDKARATRERNHPDGGGDGA